MLKVLTLYQPWAYLVVHGFKLLETRPKPTTWTADSQYLAINKGEYLIHAAKDKRFVQEIFSQEPLNQALKSLNIDFEKFEYGVILGMVTVKSCHFIFNYDTPYIIDDSKGQEIFGNELIFGDYSHGRYAWKLIDPRVLVNSIPYKGNQGYYHNFRGDESNLIYE